MGSVLMQETAQAVYILLGMLFLYSFITSFYFLILPRCQLYCW